MHTRWTAILWSGSTGPIEESSEMKNSVYPYSTGIALATAGVALAFGSGTAQAAPTPSPTVIDQLIGANYFTPTPNALAAAFVGPGANEPLYGLIGLVGQIPVVNIFIANGINGINGTNGAVGSGVNGGSAGLLIGYGGTGGLGALGAAGGNGGNGGLFFGSGGNGGAGGFAGSGGNGGNSGVLALFSTAVAVAPAGWVQPAVTAATLGSLDYSDMAVTVASAVTDCPAPWARRVEARSRTA